MRRRFFTALTISVALTACGPQPARDTVIPPNVHAVSVDGFRDALNIGGTGPEMRHIPAGEFMMGDLQGNGLDDEVPIHRVAVRAFAIGAFEVTFDDYDRFCDTTGRAKPLDAGWGRGRQPVMMVDWFDAVAYTEWLSAQTGHSYRLPTESEWEYAARAGTATNYWWGNAYEPDRANCYDCGTISLTWRAFPVGSFPANPFGLHDTVGNLWEWTASRWTAKYSGAESRALRKDEVKVTPDYLQGIQIAMRGGSWNLHPKDSRVSSRYYGAPQSKTTNLGFRVARDL